MESVFEISLVELDKIKPGFFQTRTETYDEELEDLTESIKKYGVLQPVVLRNIPDGYEVIAGDRRCRAARLAGLTRIQATVRDLNDEDALILQATENLLRQGLSDSEKKRIVGELARKCHFTVIDIADRLKKSENWVLMYYPDELKNHVKAIAGALGGQAKSEAYRKSQEFATNIVAECEYCTVGTSEPKQWENHALCPLHYSQALEDPARFKRFFGFQQQHPVIAELQKLQPLATLEGRESQISPEDSEMVETIVQLLIEKGIKPILTNQKYCLVSTILKIVAPSHNLAIYLDRGKQIDREYEKRELQKRHGMRVVSITYASQSKTETDRILNEILKEVKQ